MDTEYNFIVDKPGVRFDKYVGEKCPELSRTYAQRLIADGHITVNNRAAKASLKLSAGDRVRVFMPPRPASPLSPEVMPLDIVYEDDDLLVIDKPAGLIVHPAPGHPILVAKNGAAQMNLLDQFKAHLVVKVYLALVKGHLTPESGIIEAAIGRDPRYRKRMEVVAEGR